MASQVCTIAKGRVAELADLPLGTDNLLLVLLRDTTLPSDATLRACTTLAAVFAASGVEATFTNYARKVLGSSDITITYPSSNAQVVIAAQSWTSAGGAVDNTIQKVIVAYRPNSGSADSACIPLAHCDVSGTTASGALDMAAITFIAS